MYKIEFAGSADRRRVFETSDRRRGRVKATARVARELMTAPAVTVPAQTSVVAAAKLMESTGVKRLPVVDDLGRVIGMVTRRDLVKTFLRTDDEIRYEIVAEVLPTLTGTESSEVDAEVVDGTVTLSGVVECRSTVAGLERVVEGLDGVVGVVNRLSYHYDDVQSAVAVPALY
jgi:predicted transcriptional regulator